ncbi:hypothetical protein WOLCODRAFT_143789 [Wolfiporia cocos MD-104 SS10]|uniref:Uncharacterized protein n=1 Tax=Wolfiporia cocos (strain MD-104) TaxID=742152 RepID=A0A2H3JYU2_WOLCO|nr:hypothetical protein WOLCODRAFT_143789 [Wolfiporia cocos MD-104 SS10]
MARKVEMENQLLFKTSSNPDEPKLSVLPVEANNQIDLAEPRHIEHTISGTGLHTTVSTGQTDNNRSNSPTSSTGNSQEEEEDFESWRPRAPGDRPTAARPLKQEGKAKDKQGKAKGHAITSIRENASKTTSTQGDTKKGNERGCIIIILDAKYHLILGKIAILGGVIVDKSFYEADKLQHVADHAMQYLAQIVTNCMTTGQKLFQETLMGEWDCIIDIDPQVNAVIGGRDLQSSPGFWCLPAAAAAISML